MKNKLVTLFLCLAALTFAVQAQDKPIAKPVAEQGTTAKEKQIAKEYEDLLDKLKKGDTKIDFAKLRLAYTETKDYSPYTGG